MKRLKTLVVAGIVAATVSLTSGTVSATPTNCGTATSGRTVYGQCLSGTGRYYVYAKASKYGCWNTPTQVRFNAGTTVGIGGISTVTVPVGYTVCSRGLVKIG